MTANRERPILFSGEMVRAILDGRKTQTRRVVKLRDPSQTYAAYDDDGWPMYVDAYGDWHRDRCPYGQPGDRLWVRETWTADVGTRLSDYKGAWWHQVPASLRTRRSMEMLYYRADDSRYHGLDDLTYQLQRAGQYSAELRRSAWTPRAEDWDGVRWQSSIHMPRWASRITLEITDVRVERIQDISNHDAYREGASVSPNDDGKGAFALLWDSINAKRGYSWKSNPWIWALTFREVVA